MLRQPRMLDDGFDTSRELNLRNLYTTNLINMIANKELANRFTPMHPFQISDCSKLTNEEILQKLENGLVYQDWKTNLENAEDNLTVEPKVYVSKNMGAFADGGIIIGLQPMNRKDCRPLNPTIYPFLSPEKLNFNSESQQADFINNLTSMIESGDTAYLNMGDGHFTNMVENSEGGLKGFQHTFQQSQPTFIVPSGHA